MQLLPLSLLCLIPLASCTEQEAPPGQSAQEQEEFAADRALDPAVQAVIDKRIKAIKRNPSSAAAHRSLGLAYESNAAWSRAIRALRKSLELASDDHATRMHLAICLSAAGSDAECLQLLEQVVAAQPDGPAGLYRLGVGYLRAGRFTEARTQFTAVRNLLPSNPHGHLGLGEVAMELGDAEAALTHLQKARTVGKGNDFVDFALGQCLAELGREMEAMPLLSKGMDAVRPQIGDSLSREMSRYGVSRSALLGRAADLHEGGDPASALGILKNLEEDYPEDLVVLNNLAAAYIAVKKGELALGTLEHVLRIKNSQHSAWFNISSIHFDRAIALVNQDFPAAQPHLAKALAAADKAVLHGGHLARMHTMRGKVLMIMKSYPEAIAELGESIRLGTTNEDVFLNSSKLLTATGRSPEAFRVLLNGMQKHPDWIEVKVQCIPYFVAQRDSINARRILDEIASLAPEDTRLPAIQSLLTQNGL